MTHVIVSLKLRLAYVREQYKTVCATRLGSGYLVWNNVEVNIYKLVSALKVVKSISITESGGIYSQIEIISFLQNKNETI